MQAIDSESSYLMKTIFLLPLLLLVGSINAQTKLAYYTPDSLLTLLPEYRSAQDSLKHFELTLDSIKVSMQQEYLAAEAKLKGDSALLSPEQYQERMRGVTELKLNADAFSEAAELELIQVQTMFNTMLMAKLESIATDIAKSERIKLVAEEKKARSMSAEPGTKYVLIDITELIREEIKSQSE